MVLTVVSEGMPLIYNGQEAGHDKRLEFFERDPIVWQEHPHGELYRRLFALKHANTALWNAPWGARMVRVPNSDKTRAAQLRPAVTSRTRSSRSSTSPPRR